MDIQYANDWEARLKAIYPNKGVTPDTMMVHVFTWCSELDRLLIRNQRPSKGSAEAERINHSIVKGISWIIALCNNYDLNIASVIMARFPGVCPYCQAAPCRCEEQERVAYYPGTSTPRSNADAEEELNNKTRAFQGRKYSFDEIIKYLSLIYPANRVLLSRGHPTSVVAKLLEEGGELQAAYAQYELAKRSEFHLSTDFVGAVAEEIADLSAWMLSCWDISRENISFDKKINATFRLGCNSCNKLPCVCDPYHTSFNVEKSIERFKEELARAEKSGVAVNDAIAVAENYVDQAIKVETAKEVKEIIDIADGLSESSVKRITIAALDRLLLSKAR